MLDENVVFTRNGRIYDIASHSSDDLVLGKIRDSGNFHDFSLLDAISCLPFADGMFLDVGAAIGNSSLYFAGELNRNVMSFEMDDMNFRALQRNVVRNTLTDRIRCFHTAIGDRAGYACFRRQAGNSDGTTQVSFSQQHDGKIAQICLDEIQFTESVSCIRIDVGGREDAIVRGALKTISLFKPILIIKVEDGAGFNAIWRFLKDYEYHPVMVSSLPDTFVFCHRAMVQKCNDVMGLYYSRDFQLKLGAGVSGDALMLSREISRIKSLMTEMVKTNYALRKELQQTRTMLDQTRRAEGMWESTASDISAKYNQVIEGNSKHKPFRITAARSKIKADLALEMARPVAARPVGTYFAKEWPEASGPVHLYVLVDTLDQSLVDEVNLVFRTHIFDVQVTYLCFEQVPEGRDDARLMSGRLEALRHIARQPPGQAIAIADCSQPLKLQHFRSRVYSVLNGMSQGGIFVDSGFMLEGGQVLPVRQTTDPWSTVPVSGSLNLTLTAPNGINDLSEVLDEPGMESLPPETALALAAHRSQIQMTQMRGSQDSAARVSPERMRMHGAALMEVGLSAPFVAQEHQVDVAIIGRLAPERWQRGGIYHSNRSYVEICEKAGISHIALEIDQDIRALARAARGARLVFIYVGDQGAQDYFNVEPLVRHLDERGHTVIVNLSYDSHPERNQQIVRMLGETSDRVRLMVFSSAVGNDPAIAPYRHRLTVIPKTIRAVHPRQLSFPESRGVFMGDLGKFLNARITGDAEGIYRAVQAALPDEPILFVSQYKHSHGVPEWMSGYKLHDYDPNLLDHLCGARVYLHAQNYCTFEMLPVEAMLAGVPVLHIDMPQSLNDYIGNAGVRFATANDVPGALKSLYHQEKVWTLFSEMGRARSHDFSEKATSALLECALLPFLEKNR